MHLSAYQCKRYARSLKVEDCVFNFDGDHTNVTNELTGVYKDWSSFEHPMQGTHNFNQELEFQVQIGSKMYPEYPCMSLPQAFYELKKALGIASSAYHSISPTRGQYMGDHFIAGIDTEKVIEAGFTGLNTKQGDLMTIRAKGANYTPPQATQANPNPIFFAGATKIYIILHTDNILEIRETGSQIFD